MEGLVQDLRYAVRRLARTPGFTLVALVTLALGIGANTAIFSVVHGVLLRALPFQDPDHLYFLWSRHTSTDRYPIQLPEFCDYRDQNRTLESVAAFGNWNPNLTGDGPAERVSGLRASGNLFATLGVQAVVGRALAAADDTPGQEKVVVITYGLWQRRFGGDPAIVGRPLILNGEPFTLVGVMPRDFFLPIRTAEVAIPLAPDRDPWRQNRTSTSFLRAIGRARAGVGRAQVTEDLDGILRRLQKEYPASYGSKRGLLAVPYAEELTRNFSQGLWVLLGAVALLLLIACANLANLMLVRATERRRDMAIRQALGASRSELLRQLLVESALLSLGGALLGALLARWSVPLLVALSPEALPRARDIHVSLPVLLFTLGVAVLAAVVFGLVPALRAARVDPNRDLKAEGRGAAGAAERSRTRGWIVACQVALMMMLLTGAGLLWKSFREVMRVDAGFDPNVLTMRLSLPRKDYGELVKVSQFYRQLEARVAALPGVSSVAAVNQVPLNGALASAEYKVADRPPASDDNLPTAQYRLVTPEYFKTMGIPLISGRAFNDDDREGGAPVVVISRGLARQAFADRDPLGKYLLVRDAQARFRPLQIVGVAGDVRHTSLEAEVEPHAYLAYHQTHRDVLVWLTNNQFLLVRTAGPALALSEAVRRELQAVDSTVAAADVRASGYYLDNATAGRRFSLELLAGFAVLALAMAAIGIYGVVSYTVAQRTREIGVRLALGADMGDIARMVVGEGVRRTAVGVVVGVAGALAASRAVSGMLYGVAATDPVTYAAVIALLVAVTVAASLLPAWRASHVSPLTALRED
jgi:predicted permease